MTKEYTICLDSIEKVKEFVSITTNLFCEDIRLISNRYVVDGKSILGIFSLDLSKNIQMQLNGSKEEIDEAIQKLGRFMK